MNESSYSPEAIERIVHDLRLSGMQFAIKYVGSMLFETPMSSIRGEKRGEVAHESIIKVCREAARLRSSNIKRDETHLQKCATSEPFDIFDEQMDVNIASRKISLLQYVEFGVRVIASFELTDISLFAQGADEYISYICFFAYYYDEWRNHFRRCFVLEATPCADEMMEAFNFAMQVYQLDEKVKRQKSSENDKNLCLNKIPALQLDGVDIEVDNKEKRTLTTRCTSNSPMLSEGISSSRMNKLYTSFERMQGRERNRERSTSRHRSTSSHRMEDERAANVWNQPWFHGTLERSVAETLVNRPGQFLVRISPTSENQFVLTALSRDERYYHIALMEDDGQMCLGNAFKTIVGFIYYCRHHPEFLPSHEIDVKLSEVIPCARSFLIDEEDLTADSDMN